MKTAYILVPIAVIMVAGAALFNITNLNDSKPVQDNTLQIQGTSKPKPTTQAMNKPEIEIDEAKNYSAVLKTSEGDIAIKLNSKATPITANNFIALAKKSFYNGTVFHRIIDGFMIQGGDPEGTGRGGPGYQFDDEPFEGEYKRGIVAMANAGPNTNGSQFFIMHQDYPLPANYVIFGEVTSGMEVVDKIATAETKPGGEGSTPVNPVTVESVEIIEK